MELYVKELPPSCSSCRFFYIKSPTEKYSEYPACKLLWALDMEECLGNKSQYSENMIKGFISFRCPLKKIP